ncbi:MAG: EpsI family protein [Planctomycetes bacterium]|nr:EpsI family protein [Planctomycetota bacterium]
MTTKIMPHFRSVISAALVASLIILVSGLTYHGMAERLAAPSDRAPIDPNLLAQFPLKIGEWTGHEVLLDEDIVRATDTDAHLNRRYVHANGTEALTFYVACGVQARDLMPHRPEVCYVGNGWTLTDKRSLELTLDDGVKLPCNVMQFSRGGLVTDKLMVLDYYLVDGAYCHDLSLLRSKAWRGSTAVDYVAQVQIVTAVAETRNEGAAETQSVSDFAVATASPLAGFFEKPEPLIDTDKRDQQQKQD